MLSSSPRKFLTGLLAGLTLCFLLQGIAFFGLNGMAAKTESNYFSTLGRFQAASGTEVKFALVGSSITGRLPGRESGNEEVANLGADGGSPLEGLEIVESGVISKPAWIVLEVNTLFNQLGLKRRPVVEATRGTWFLTGARFPLVGATARPSGMLYNAILSRGRPSDIRPFPIGESSSELPVGMRYPYSAGERARLDDVSGRLLRLKSAGMKILLVRYPAGAVTRDEQMRLEAAVSDLSIGIGAPYLDLSSRIARNDLEFTDSVHLGPVSAARILATIRLYCRDHSAPLLHD